MSTNRRQQYLLVNAQLRSESIDRLTQSAIGAVYRNDAAIFVFDSESGLISRMTDVQREGKGIHAKYTYDWVEVIE
jgi:hypothetical protein